MRLSKPFQRDFDRAAHFFETELRLWLPDEESSWGRRLRLLIARIGPRRIRIPEGLTFAKCRGIETLDGDARKYQMARWRSVLGETLLPTRVLERLTEQLPQPSAVRVLVARRHRVHYCVIVNNRDASAAVGRRMIRYKQKQAFHELLHVDSEHQKSGIAGRLLANTIRLYVELGIKSVRLTAGLSAGGSVWPKLGFLPVSEAEWKKIHKTIRVNLSRLEQLIEGTPTVLGQPLDVYVTKVLGLKGVAGIWAISDLDKTAAHIQIPGYRYGIGSYLLQGSRWKGILELQGPPLDRFKNFARSKGYFDEDY
jgi:GNAT superfamily N-acetyltransferase